MLSIINHALLHVPASNKGGCFESNKSLFFILSFLIFFHLYTNSICSPLSFSDRGGGGGGASLGNMSVSMVTSWGCATPSTVPSISSTPRYKAHWMMTIISHITYEPSRGKTNVVSEQVRHKPTCTVTQKS